MDGTEGGGPTPWEGRILGLLERGGPKGLSKIARSLDISRTSAWRYLKNLEQKGLVANKDRKWFAARPIEATAAPKLTASIQNPASVVDWVSYYLRFTSAVDSGHRREAYGIRDEVLRVSSLVEWDIPLDLWWYISLERELGHEPSLGEMESWLTDLDEVASYLQLLPRWQRSGRPGVPAGDLPNDLFLEKVLGPEAFEVEALASLAAELDDKEAKAYMSLEEDGRRLEACHPILTTSPIPAFLFAFYYNVDAALRDLGHDHRLRRAVKEAPGVPHHDVVYPEGEDPGQETPQALGVAGGA